MSTHPVLQQRQIQQVIDGFFAFFEWCHGVSFGPRERACLQDVIIARWDDSAGPSRKLVGYVAALWGQVTAEPLHQRDRLRPQAQAIIQRLLHQAGGRGPVVATLHQILETLRPGSSGVPLPLSGQPQPSTWPVAPAAAPAYAGQPYPGQPYPGQPYSGQPYPNQPYPGQQNSWQPHPGPAMPAQGSSWPVGPAQGPANPTDEQLYEQKLQIVARSQAIQQQLAIDNAINQSTQRILDSMSR